MRQLLADASCEPRVGALTKVLGVEKSTASRVARGVRAADGVEALREFPAVEGILKVVAACEAHGAPRKSAATAREAIEELRKCFDAIPGGRIVAVEALRGGVARPSRRIKPGDARTPAREERAAARAIFSGMRSIHGCAVDFNYNLRIQLPAAKGDQLEPASVSIMQGFVRLRPGVPMRLHGSRIRRDDEPASGLQTLEGEPIGFHIERTMMNEFCAGPHDRLLSRREDPFVYLELGPEDPPIDRPMTVAFAFRELARDQRFASADVRFGCIRHMFRRPTERACLEFMVPHGSLASAAPVFRCSQDFFGKPDLLHGPPADGRDGIAVGARYVPMGRGIGAAPEGCPVVTDALKRVFERLRLDPDAFDRFRLELAYPLLGVWNEMWYELPPRPARATSGRAVAMRRSKAR